MSIFCLLSYCILNIRLGDPHVKLTFFKNDINNEAKINASFACLLAIIYDHELNLENSTLKFMYSDCFTKNNFSRINIITSSILVKIMNKLTKHEKNDKNFCRNIISKLKMNNEIFLSPILSLEIITLYEKMQQDYIWKNKVYFLNKILLIYFLDYKIFCNNNLSFFSDLYKTILNTRSKKYIELNAQIGPRSQVLTNAEVKKFCKSQKIHDEPFYFYIRFFESFFVYFFHYSKMPKLLTKKKPIINLEKIKSELTTNYFYHNYKTMKLDFQNLQTGYKECILDITKKKSNNVYGYFIMFVDWCILSTVVEFFLINIFPNNEEIVKYLKSTFIETYKIIYYESAKYVYTNIIVPVESSKISSKRINDISIYKITQDG